MGRRSAGPRFSVEPLLCWIPEPLLRSGVDSSWGDLRDLSLMRAIDRGKHDGLSLRQADVLGCRFAGHPALVWEEWDAVVDDWPDAPDSSGYCEVCGGPMPPPARRGSTQRYCTMTCLRRAYRLRRRLSGRP